MAGTGNLSAVLKKKGELVLVSTTMEANSTSMVLSTTFIILIQE